MHYLFFTHTAPRLVHFPFSLARTIRQLSLKKKKKATAPLLSFEYLLKSNFNSFKKFYKPSKLLLLFYPLKAYHKQALLQFL